ncbi:MAG TPA: HDIG domain-containing protein [Syntrophales bacterium]|nr:HDIG domain-containing protein [Syntrophales bacterium]
MAKNISDRIPSREECNELMVQHSMRPNIIEHSIQVMHVSLAITDNLKNGIAVNRDLVIAAALLHDITKTRSLKTNERHDISGGELLRKIGFTRIAEIVEQHIVLQNLNPQGILEEREIIYYADKRVMHDKIVTIDERVHDLLQRYGNGEEIRSLISQNKNLILAVESKITSFMKIDINRAIEEMKAN